MAYTTFFPHYDPVLGETDESIPDGYHVRATLMIRAGRRACRRKGCAAYSLSRHRRARQIGPVPLPFTHRRTRW